MPQDKEQATIVVQLGPVQTDGQRSTIDVTIVHPVRGTAMIPAAWVKEPRAPYYLAAPRLIHQPECGAVAGAKPKRSVEIRGVMKRTLEMAQTRPVRVEAAG